MSKTAMKLALDALEKGDLLCEVTAANILRQALAEPEQPARAQMTQAVAEELAHRRCRRYIMIDTEAPYQFDGHTLMYFVADIEKATIKESLTVESNSARVPFLPGEYENTLLKTEKARKQL